MVLEKTLTWVFPWTARRSNQSILKELSPGCSLEGLMLKLKLQYWPPDTKSWLIWKDPDAGKDWGQEEKGKTGDKMVRWHHWLNECEFVWIPWAGDGQGGLACCGSWSRKELDMTEWLTWTETKDLLYSTRNSIQYSVMAYMMKKLERVYIHTCIMDSLLCTPETNTMLQINYTTVIIFKKYMHKKTLIKLNIHSW